MVEKRGLEPPIIEPAEIPLISDSEASNATHEQPAQIHTPVVEHTEPVEIASSSISSQAAEAPVKPIAKPLDIESVLDHSDTEKVGLHEIEESVEKMFGANSEEVP